LDGLPTLKLRLLNFKLWSPKDSLKFFQGSSRLQTQHFRIFCNRKRGKRGDPKNGAATRIEGDRKWEVWTSLCSKINENIYVWNTGLIGIGRSAFFLKSFNLLLKDKIAFFWKLYPMHSLIPIKLV